MTPFKTRAALVAAALTVAGLARPAHAGGMYYSERGVRPLARGGAFVAGADDLGAIWFNPAGIADAGGTMLFDASLMLFNADFTRQTQVVDAGGTVRTYDYPSVHGDTPPLAFPTLAIAFPAGDHRQWTFAGGVFAPYAPLLRWPETVNGQPAPQRYSLISLEGTVLAGLGAYASYKFSDKLRVGAGLELLTGVFQSLLYFNANPADRLLGPPQAPEYDSLGQLRATVITPSGNLGVIYKPIEQLRFGLSGQLPFWVDAPATVRVRLPTAAEFDAAVQTGDSAHVKFRLPPILRAGVEVRPVPALRVEAAYEREFWSVHDTIDVTSDDVSLSGIYGFPSPFHVGTISMPRHFQDSNSFRLGGEYRVDVSAATKLDLRLGFSYETSAIPTAYVSPLTIDGDKATLSVGAGLHIGPRWRFDAVFAYTIMPDITVPPSEAAIPLVNPVSGYPTQTEAVNGGKYSVSAPIIGLGFQYAFDLAPPAAAAPPRGHETKPKPAPPPEDRKTEPPPEKPDADAADASGGSASPDEEPKPPPKHKKPPKKKHTHHHHKKKKKK